ncbi:unnamed protein product [Didymodactylos carnosus]|uniref:Uncharacterized protein n=1 Tax=Didymodactylos carnosus TaxID=1234261 RepID=A0A814TXT1_9BILA|nr:unnamed protein product [Didymodactylos carnosus]CAF1166210.1 unnamed protein product [Didymodactylos carnosus]CAF3826646.1 unnamed protein product [Didymodactylos carnosus]CAF3929877.1 unnamed protein product [Didymodactylos carnosus]
MSGLRDSVEPGQTQRPAPPNSATIQDLADYYHTSSLNYWPKTKLKRSLTTQLIDGDTVGLKESYSMRGIHGFFPQTRKTRAKVISSEKRSRQHAYMSLVPADNKTTITSTSDKSSISLNRSFKNKSPPLSTYSVTLTTATNSFSLPQVQQSTSTSIKREHSSRTQNADDRQLTYTGVDTPQYYGTYTIPRVNSWVQRWKTNYEMHTLSNLMRDSPNRIMKKRSFMTKHDHYAQNDSILSSASSFCQYKKKRS